MNEITESADQGQEKSVLTEPDPTPIAGEEPAVVAPPAAAVDPEPESLDTTEVESDFESSPPMPGPNHVGQVPPPVAPPTGTRRPRGRSAWLMGLLAVVLVASSAGITYLLTTRQDSTTTATTVATAGEGQDSTPIVPGEEPVADAAEVILPSVVQIQSADGVGSGVVYDADGLIITAAHVVAGNDTVTVRLNDGEQIQGTVLGGTSDADVALVKVERTGLTPATLALDSTPRVGEMAIAVGSPWALQGTVTAGIVSAVNQPIGCLQPGGNCRSLLQTDAAINPGNSGGALVDRQGRLIGINVSIFSASGANDGVGFAVPVSVANDIAQAVINGEDLGTAYLGVVGRNVDSGRAGAMITEVAPDSGASQAGVQVGDLVISLDGVPVQGIDDLAAQVRTHRPGTTVDMTVVRNGQEMTLSVTLGDLPDNLG
ncbi:MAG: trypsin-like peptidase domain-containing protein [Acidimicrobiia bacterium]